MPIINVNIPLKKKIYGVTELNRQSRSMLERQFHNVHIEGELSNLSKPGSGHIYFKLKDAQSQIQCAFFRNKAMFLNLDLKEGMQIVATATVSLYEARGDYQLIVESIELAGIGQLQLKFDALKRKLQRQGLFDSAHKKNLPKLPKCIGVITSPTGAALQDILTTLKRRFPAIPIYLYPTQVQGALAASQIVAQIKHANAHNQCDVLILARGGGSLEDLWPFNEEMVAKAIYQSKLPMVSGVGHEIDVTLADFCADYRAATPTAAAESVTPNINDVLSYLEKRQAHLKNVIKAFLLKRQHALHHLSQRLRSPNQLIHQKLLHVDALSIRLEHSLQLTLHLRQNRLQRLYQALIKHNPMTLLKNQRITLNQFENRLTQAVNQCLIKHQQHFKQLCATLHATSPLATIDRGYSLALKEDQSLISSIEQIDENQTFWVRLKDGQLHAKLINKNGSILTLLGNNSMDPAPTK